MGQVRGQVSALVLALLTMSCFLIYETWYCLAPKFSLSLKQNLDSMWTIISESLNTVPGIGLFLSAGFSLLSLFPATLYYFCWQDCYCPPWFHGATYLFNHGFIQPWPHWDSIYWAFTSVHKEEIYHGLQPLPASGNTSLPPKSSGSF